MFVTTISTPSLWFSPLENPGRYAAKIYNFGSKQALLLAW
jgi:hypothetical protein